MSIVLYVGGDNAAPAAALADKLEARGFTCRVCSPFTPLPDFPRPELLCGPEKALEGAELMLCLGGDGTILSGSKLAARADIPILGINYGHKGFIAALEPEDVEEALDRVLRGDYVTEKRMMVEAEVWRGGEKLHEALGLNEAVIRSAGSHPVSLTVYADGVVTSAFSGDGVIVATPTGSTAYSMSAGGPIVEPVAHNLILTPICAHALNAKTVVLSPERVVTVVPEPSQSFEAVLSVDGDRPFPLQVGDEVRVRRSERATRLIVGDKRSFYEIVNSKLNARI